MPSTRMIIFVLVVILFVGLFYSIVKPCHRFVEGATTTRQNEFDAAYDRGNIRKLCEGLPETNKMYELQNREWNNQLKGQLSEMTNSKFFENFNIINDPQVSRLAGFFGGITNENKMLYSRIIDKMISMMKDIKFTYLQTPDNSAQTSSSNNSSTTRSFVQPVSGSRV